MKFGTAVSGLTEPTHPLDIGGRNNVRSPEKANREPMVAERTPHARSRHGGNHATRLYSRTLNQGAVTAQAGIVTGEARRDPCNDPKVPSSLRSEAV